MPSLPERGACPICGARADEADPATRPFCSERCKLIDLGAWASGRYRVPGEKIDADQGEPEAAGEPETDDPAPGRDREGGGRS